MISEYAYAIVWQGSLLERNERGSKMSAQGNEQTTYDDIYVRDNFGDRGIFPSTGAPYQSPDIIPYQNGILNWTQVLSTYANGPDLGKSIVNPGLNNIFIRAKNLQQSGTETGSASLYYAKSSLLLLPNQWTQAQTGGGQSSIPFLNQSNNTQINPNEICLGSQAFVLTGLPPVQGDHYCLIGVIQTPRHPVTLPTSFPSNTAFAQWVQTTPAVAWRNISVIPNTLVQSVSSYPFGSTSADQAYYHFRVMSPSGKNFPINTTVNVQCTDPRSPINWSGTLPAPDANGNQITGFDSYMPGNFMTSLTATVTSPNGQPFPTGAQLSISYYQYPSAAMDQLELSVGRHYPIARVVEGVGPVAFTAFLILLGECWLYVESLS
jgi:hypothetical protein